jgi:hypothetical protein
MAEPLSPAARAVLDAAFSAYWSAEQEAPNDEGMIAAAALRAATDQCKIEWNYHPDYPETEWVIIVSDLLAIAAELEALPE